MKIKSFIVIIFAVFVVLQFSGCNKLENVTNSGSKLVLWSIHGLDDTGQPTTVVLSDVLFQDADTTTVINDNGEASFTASLLDPVKSGPADASFYQQVIVDQVDIVYSRADGLNVEGKDVPYAFSQKVHHGIEVNSTTVSNLGFILVQHIAKNESPLAELVNLGQEHVLKVEARCTFHSRDQAGYRLEPVVGYISIWFANYGN
jgi:hypothetical protein